MVASHNIENLYKKKKKREKLWYYGSSRGKFTYRNRKEKLCFKIKCYDKLTMKTERSLDNYKLNGNFLDDKQHQNGINDDFLIFMCHCDGVFLWFESKGLLAQIFLICILI